MANWHVGGAKPVTKADIIYHTIMFVFNIILLVIAIGYFVFILLYKGFYFEVLMGVLFVLFFAIMHNAEIKRCASEYVKTADYRYALNNPSKIDNIIISLVHHYNKK